MPGKTDSRVKKMAGDLVKLAESVDKRVAEDGQILGWRGFHIDLDEIEEKVELMKLAVRGVFKDESVPPDWGDPHEATSAERSEERK